MIYVDEELIEARESEQPMPFDQLEQKEAAGFLLSLPGAVNLLPEESGLATGDFADTAALIEQLSLIITVDTAIAHLAGAMGKPCWVLLPYVGSDWRWLQDGRSDSPWYASVRIYRQPAIGDWASVLQRIAQDLPAFFGQAVTPA